MMKEDKYQWNVEEAFIMHASSHNLFEKFDIGITMISTSGTLLFDRLSLEQNDAQLRDAPRVPACLAAKNYNAKSDTLLGTGWGREYKQAPENNPLYSTCMTSEAGPVDWRFQNCQIRGNTAGCNKFFPPLGYDEAKCKKYFNDARLKKDKRTVEEIDNMDILYITGPPSNGVRGIESTCVQPRLFKDPGWCFLEVRNTTKLDDHPWGICSPSCSAQVRNSPLWFKL